MAKFNGILSNIKGSLGNLTFKQNGGQTIVSEKITQMADSKTESQQRQRMKWTNVIRMYQVLSPYMKQAFGGTTDPYNVCAAEGLLEPYQAENASHLLGDAYRDPDGNWYGIYKGILGFMVNTDELTRLGLEIPQDWADLTKPEYKGLVWLSNYNTAGTAKLIINTMIQKYGHDPDGSAHRC